MKFILKFVVVITIALLVAIVSLSIWLKTEAAKQQIASFAENFVAKEFGIQANIEGLDISLPIILGAKQVSFKDAGGEIVVIKNFYINIIPSLMSFWEINIWNLSADEIRLFKKPKFKFSHKEEDKGDSLFNPNIMIKDINFSSIILDKEFTGQSQDIIFSVDSYVMFKAKSQIVDCSLVSKLLSPPIENFPDNQLALVGRYDLKNDLIDLRSIKFTSQILRAEGELLADLKRDKLSGGIKYKIENISKLPLAKANDLGGSFVGQIGLEGAASSPIVKTSGNLDISLPKNDYFNYFPLSFAGDFRIEPKGVDGSISLKQGDITAKSSIKYKDSKLYLEQARAEATDFLNTADLIFDTEKKVIVGNVRFIDKNLKESSKYFPFLKSGAVDLNFKLSSRDNISQQVKVDGKLKRLNTKYGSFGYVDIDLNVMDLWNAALGESFLKIRTFNYGDIVIKETKLGIKSDSGTFYLDNSVISGQPYPVNLKFNSSIKSDSASNELIAKITNLSGTLKEVPIKQGADIDISIGLNQIFKAQNLKVGDGFINLDTKFNDSKIYANVVMDKVPIFAMPNIFPDIFDKASISSKIILSGTNSNPQLDANLLLTNIGPDTKRNDLSVKVNGKYQNKQMNLDLKFLEQEQELAKSDLVLPIKFSLKPWEFVIHEKESFNANLLIYENFDLISFIPMPVGHEVSGNLQGNFKASGSLAHPQIFGKMNLSNGEYTYKQYGAEFKNISGDIIAKNSNFILNNFVVEDNFGNKITSNGKINLEDANKFSVNIATKKFHPMSTRYLQGEVVGNIDIIGNNEQAKAKGVLDLGPLEIKIPEHFRQNIPTLNISEVIEENDVVITKEESNPYKLDFDIKLSAGKQVYVRGWGVDTQLKGKLHITGQADNPIITGALRSERGRYQEFGKVLNVKEGVLNFDGPVPPSPYLNIVGVTNVGDTEIRLVLSGSILNPYISIESTPAYIQETALSKLLFGNDPENISTFQALQLANGMRRLSGHGGGFDPLSFGRKILGVDDISFKQNSEDPNKTSVGVGKHLTDKVYFEVESGRSENSTKTRVEVELTPKISIENVFEPEGNTSVGVNWKFDY